MKKHLITSISFFMLSFSAIGQQLPFYTQHSSNSFVINPGSTGVKRLIDARINYRQQWTGYEGAPHTATIGLNSRLFKGKMGAGFSIVQDETGPIKKLNFAGTYAYHIQFPDCELSAGLSGIVTQSTLTGSKITLHNSQDHAIDQSLTNSTFSEDMGVGIYLYNDRFHVGISVLQPLQSKAEFYKNDTLKKGLIKDAIHLNVSLGYNYSQNPDYIWQSTLFSSYINGAPLLLDYTLLLHYKEKMFGGFSIRLGDAAALHIGCSFLNDFQVSYSYDFVISGLRAYNAGSHEITLVYSTDLIRSKHGKVNDRFLRQKYGYLF
jgi:type IX secretion system PorP/SprF family membrane protein